jgi:hypothetical protein
MRAVGSNSWTVLWMCAPKVIQSNVTPAPRSPLEALTVTSLALEYQSGQTKAELSDQLGRRDLPKTGNVDELVERLVEADSK